MKSNPTEIEARLTTVRGRIRRTQWQRAAMLVATVALGGLLVVMAIDALAGPLPMPARWALSGAWLLLVLIAVKAGCAPLLIPIGLMQVARWLETRHPEMQERLSTVLELRAHDGGGSADLLESLARAAEADAATVNADTEVQAARTSRRWGKPALALAIAMALAFVIWPSETSRLLVRAVAPFSSRGNTAAGRFIVTPGNLEVLAGDAVHIETRYDGSAKDLTLLMEFENGTQLSQAMTRVGNLFDFRLEPAKQSFRYRVQAGREESDAYVVTVLPLPEIRDARVALQFPEYTGAPAEEFALDHGIAAVSGTKVVLTGRINTPVVSGSLALGGKHLAEAIIEASANGGRIRYEWTLAAGESGEAVAMLNHRLKPDIDALQVTVEVLDDHAPEVVLLKPIQHELTVRPDDVLEMSYEVSEDFSLAMVSVEVDPGNNKTVLLDQAVPPQIARSKPPRFRGDAPVAIGELRSRFPGLNDVRLRIRAEDKRPTELRGPGVGVSEWVKLRINDGAESLARQELRQEHEGARQTIEDAMRETREAREQMDRHRDEIKRADLNDNARKDLKEAAEKLAAAQEKLAELAKQMEEGVHAKKSDEVAKAAEMVAKARENLENSPLQDEAPQRDATLQQSRDQAEDAVKQMENVRNAMDREREKIEDLAKLQDLAQQQQEVARQAKENLTTKADPKAWQDQQRRVEDGIKQQISNQPQAKAEALKDQAEAAKALAEQAKEMSDSQNKLSEQAKQPSQESLQNALAAEQAKIADEAKAELAKAQEARSERADTLPEASSAAEAARDALNQDKPQAAADSAKEAAAAMKKSAEAKGDSENTAAQAEQAEALEQLAKREENIAKAAEALAKGDQAEALKQLQSAQANEAGDLAKAISDLPQIERTGHTQDAANDANQGSQQADSAAKQGQQGQQQEASKQHEQAGQNFAKSAEALKQAAEEFAQRAQQAAGESQNPQRAQVPADAMADAFQQAAKAADNNQSAQAAAQAANAAQALSQAAQSAMQQMQGKQPGPPKPGQQPGMPNMPGGPPSNDPKADMRPPEADPGVPPELARLGMSSADWEKIKASLKSDVGAGEGAAVPEEYRELVRGYFESISQKSSKQ